MKHLHKGSLLQATCPKHCFDRTLQHKMHSVQGAIDPVVIAVINCAIDCHKFLHQRFFFVLPQPAYVVLDLRWSLVPLLYLNNLSEWFITFAASLLVLNAISIPKHITSTHLFKLSCQHIKINDADGSLSFPLSQINDSSLSCTSLLMRRTTSTQSSITSNF